MADTVLSAQMTEGELYNSIDKELSKGEKRFDSFVTNVNKTLGSINANFGDGLTKTFNGQIDNMSAKIKQLEIQLNSLTGNKNNIKITTNDSNKNTPAVNVNDIDSYYANLSKRINTTTLEEGRMRMHEISAEIDKLKNKQIDINIKVDDKYKSQLDDLNNKIKSLELEKENLKKVSITGNQDIKAITQQFDNLNSQINNYKSQINSINKLRISNADATPNVEKINSLKQEYDNIEKSIRSTQRGTETFAQVQSKLNGPTVLNGISAATERLNGQDLSLIRLNEHYKNLEVSSKRVQTAQRNSIKSEISTVSKMPTNDIDEANDKLKKFQEIRNRISNDKNPLLSPSEIQSLDTKVSNLTRKLEILHSKVNQPLALNDVMSMPTGNLNQITAKMSAISTLRGNYSPQSAELVQLNREYQNLSKTQNEALNAGVQLKEGNNKLVTSFENLSKRVVFYTGLGALTGFVTQLYSIRGEYEMLERSMGAILGSFQEGSKIFNQIQQQALQSPMTVIDLSNAAKQLIAYNFSMNEVAITTKKMADISSALGVPMERMTYNLGQIKAQGFLTSRDARDFANAGLAVVPKLAEMYSNLNGKVVTTSEVYDMLTKKMVPYSDVMKVINGLTDEGGMFFDFQAKQAETLKGQLSNLVDAWNMMLNQIGQSNEGIMKGSISGLRELFNNWRAIESAVEGVVIAYGAYKAYQIIANATIGQANLGLSGLIGSENRHRLVSLQKIAVTRQLTAEEQAELNSYTRKSTLLGLVTYRTKEATNADYEEMFVKNKLTSSQAKWLVGLGFANDRMKASIVNSKLMTVEQVNALSGTNRWATGLKLLGLSFKDLGLSIMAMMPQMAAMLAITSLMTWWSESRQRAEEQADLNKSIADQAKQTVDDLNQYLKDNQPTIAIAQKGNMDNDNSLKLWDNLKEEIQKTSSASDYFIAKLLDINNIQSRNKAAIEYIKLLRDTAEAMKGISDVDITTTDTGPWGLFSEGLVSKLKEYADAFKNLKEHYNDYASSTKNAKSLSDFTEGGGWGATELAISQKAAQEEIDKSLKLMEQSVNERGIYLDKDKNKFIEAMSQEVAAFKKANPEIQGAMAELLDKGLDKKLGTHEAAWSKFMDVLKNTSSAAFSDITTDGLEQWDGYNSKSNKKMDQGIKAALKTLQKSSPDFYNEVYKMIQNAPDFKIRIGLAFNISQMGDLQKDYMNRLQQQVGMFSKDYNKLTVYQPSGSEDISEWKKKMQEAIAKNKAEINDFSGKPSKISKTIVKDLTEENRLRAESLKLYDLSSESDKDLAKQKKQRDAAYKKQLSEEAQAIKNEIDLIDKLSSNYDKLTQKGMQNGAAVKLLSKEYQSSIGNIDKVLGKYGIPKFDIKQFVGSDASGQLNYLEKLRDTMKSKGLDRLKPDAYKEVSVQIQKLSVDAKTYDLSKITDGLKEQLDSIKESYQLGQDIKDNPAQWNLLSNIIQVTPDDVKKMVKTAKEAALEVQDQIDLAIKQYNSKNKANVSGYSMYFGDSDRKKWMQQNDFSKDNELTKGLNAARKEAQDILTKDYSQNVKSWDELLSKYAEYEYKKNDIQKTAAKERLTLVKNFGTSDEYKKAFDLANQIQISQDPEVIAKLQDDLTKLVNSITKKKPESVQIGIAIGKKAESSTEELNFNQFKETDLYAKAFEDLSRVGTSTLDLLYAKLQQIASATKDPVQLKTIMKSLKDVRAQLQDRAPIDTLIQGINDWKAADKELNLLKQTEDVKNFVKARKDLKDAESDVNSDKTKGKDSTESTQRQLKAQQELNKAMNSNDVKAYIQAEDDLYQAQTDTAKGISGMSSGFQKFSDLGNNVISLIKSLADGLGIAFSDDTERIISNIGKAFAVVSAAMGVLAAAELFATKAGIALMSTLWPLLAVAAALTIAFTLFGNKNAKIDKEIKESQIRVKNLENAYKDLDRAVSSAMGDSEIGAKRAAIANKQLQLVELQRQLALEKSRSSKKQDKDKIADLEGQIIDLKNSITDTVNSVVTDLLGISSAKDAAESLVTNMIEAFRNGEDYMKQYSESFDKMIDNMIMKAIVSKVIGDKIQKMLDTLQSRIDQRTKAAEEKLSAAFMRDNISDDQIMRLMQSQGSVELIADFRKKLDGEYQQALKEYNEATSITPDDVNFIRQSGQSFKGDVKSQIEQLAEAFGLKFGDSKTSDLSSLQQGIQSITETQASALEAIMNGVSGQVYSQTTILQNILNNSNVSLGTQSQLLLQMRESYQIQKSIQSILTGWSNNSGRAIMVELTK